MRMLATTAATAAVVLVAGCGVRPTPVRATELTFVSYGGVIQQAIVDAWQTPYRGVRPGIRFINTSPPDLGQIRAQVDAGAVGWNIVTVPPGHAIENCGTLYEKLKVPGLDDDQFAPGTHGECFVAALRYSVIFSYNTEKWPDPEAAPKAVADFFDVERFPGKRGVAATLTDGILEWALLADGVDPASLYPLDVDRALAKWASIRDHTTWTANADQLLALVRSQEVDMQLLLQPHTLAAIDREVPIAPVWDVTLTTVSGLAIPRGSAYTEHALQFLSFVLQPNQQSRIAEVTAVEPVNRDADPNRSVNSNSVNAFGPANTGTTVAIDQQWWGQNWADALAEFNAWRNPPPAS
ncbi:MAG: extracellular solute-binding protein [Micromonosporaceae bacterium]|nr:extracellular solute-binding protein [Micromonosporaceae bacterium]